MKSMALGPFDNTCAPSTEKLPERRQEFGKPDPSSIQNG